MNNFKNKKPHSSWIISYICLGLIFGIAVAPIFEVRLPTAQLYICAVIIAGFSLYKRNLSIIILAAIAGVLIGFARGNSVYMTTNVYENLRGKNLEISGKIIDDPTLSSSGGQRVMLKNITVNNTEISGKIWVETNAQVKLKRSDSVVFYGKLGEGFGTISASMNRAKLVGVDRIKHGDVGLEVRDWFASAVRVNISSTEASLGVGYLVGQRSDLPESLDEKLRLLGLTHVVVASGYNLTILVRFARRIFVKYSKYLAVTSAAVMIFSFVAITGASPSMSRAALVTGLSLVAWYYGRRIHPYVLLPFSAAVTALLSPSYVWGDIGWYLSFLSFAGILILAPLLRSYFFGDKSPPQLVMIFIETMSAQIATLPIIAYVFGYYSLLALPANMLILPLVPFAMACTFMAGVFQILVPSFAVLAAWPAQIILSYMTKVIDWLGEVPGGHGDIKVGISILVGGYLLLVLLILCLLKKTKFNFKKENIVV